MFSIRVDSVTMALLLHLRTDPEGFQPYVIVACSWQLAMRVETFSSSLEVILRFDEDLDFLAQDGYSGQLIQT